ncbi:MAG: hypothetical protein BWK76_09510 [Desulfobulbaceae bacterium A2]|nr:MAG: hypothetical protein BWK76_09510 [Desulfobulbaceae bacterium A2]
MLAPAPAQPAARAERTRAQGHCPAPTVWCHRAFSFPLCTLSLWCCLSVPDIGQGTSLTIRDLRVDTSVDLLAEIAPPPANGEEALTISAEVQEEPAILDIHRDIFQHTWSRSPDIRMARLQVKQKAALRYTAWARRLSPKVDLELAQKRTVNKSDATASETETTAPTSPAPTPTPTTTETSYVIGPTDTPATGVTDVATAEAAYVDGNNVTDWTFSLDLPIYRRSVSLQVDAARLDENLATLGLEIMTLELDSKVRTLLGNYLLARYKLLNLHNSVELARAHVTRIQRGYELRDQTRLSLLRAEANLKELEARRDVNEQQEQVALRELLNFTGMDGQEPVFGSLNELTTGEARTAGCITVLADLSKGLVHIRQLAPNDDLDGLRQRFMSHSPLVRKYSLERRSNDIKARSHTQTEWPDLALKGEYARKEDSRFSEYEGEGYIGVALSLPLFSGGTTISSLRTQDLTLKMSSLGEYSQLRSTYFGLENKKKSIDSLCMVLEKQRINLEQQEEIVRLSIKSFKMKETSMQDLLTAQNKLIDTKNLHMSTTYELGALLRQFAWELGAPLPSPPTPPHN